MGSIAICIPCRMPLSTNGTKVFCIYCGFAKDTYTYSPPKIPSVSQPPAFKMPSHLPIQPDGTVSLPLVGSNTLPKSAKFFRNGLELKMDQDYVFAVDGTSVTFTGSASAGDVISLTYIQ